LEKKEESIKKKLLIQGHFCFAMLKRQSREDSDGLEDNCWVKFTILSGKKKKKEKCN